MFVESNNVSRFSDDCNRLVVSEDKFKVEFSDTTDDESSSSVALDEKMKDVVIVVENEESVCIIDVWMWLGGKVSVKIDEKSVAK